MDEMIQKILANIQSILPNSSLSESFYEVVLNRLVSFGYTLKEEDAWSLCFVSSKVESHFNNSCNTTSIPDGLFFEAVDRVCGEFLFIKKQTKQLDIADLDLTGAVTSISAGDTTVQFAGGSSDEDRFNQLIDYLLNRGEGDLVCYRRLKW